MHHAQSLIWATYMRSFYFIFYFIYLFIYLFIYFPKASSRFLLHYISANSNGSGKTALMRKLAFSGRLCHKYESCICLCSLLRDLDVCKQHRDIMNNAAAEYINL